MTLCSMLFLDLPRSFASVSAVTVVPEGTHVLTNGELDAPWHKAEVRLPP